MPRESSLRSVPDELRSRYLREGLWSDETLGALVDACVRARPALAFHIWSERRPFTSRVSDVDAQARRLAAGLQARGLGPRDVVAFQLPKKFVLRYDLRGEQATGEADERTTHGWRGLGRSGVEPHGHPHLAPARQHADRAAGDRADDV